MILALLRGLDDSLLSGHIRIDGVDTCSMPLKSLRQALSLVAQDPFLWHASIRENLDPEGLVEEKDIWAAIERVGMKDAIASLSDKLDTVLEDEGSLSKGQVGVIHYSVLWALLIPDISDNCSAWPGCCCENVRLLSWMKPVAGKSHPRQLFLRDSCYLAVWTLKPTRKCGRSFEQN